MRPWSLALFAALAGCPATPATGPDKVRVVEGSLEAKALLAAQSEAARKAGAGGLEVVGGEVLAEGGQIGGFVEIPDAACVLVIASPGESVDDVDLFVYADDGERLAADESPAPSAAALVCPPHPRRAFVVARAMRGSGIVALGVMQVAASAADAVARAVEVRGRPGEDTGKLGAWPGLERKIRERRERLGGRWEDVRRVALHVDARAEAALSFGIDENRCLDVLVVPSDELAGIDVQLVDGEGRIIAHASPPARDRAIVVCSGLREGLTLLVRPRGGSGTVAVVVARSPEGARSELGDQATLVDATALEPLEAAVGRRRRALAAAGLDPKDLFRLDLTAGTSVSREVTLEPGCTRLDVVGGAPLGHFTASLWSAEGKLLSEARGGASAALFWCAAAATPSRVEIVAEERAGSAAVTSLRTDAPELALAHPRAAARLLSRLEEGLGPLTSRDLASLSALPIGPDARTPAELSIDEGCVEIVAAVAEAEQGIELRVENAEDEEVMRARGHGVVGRTICRDQTPARFTLRSSVKPTTALVVRVPR